MMYIKQNILSLLDYFQWKVILTLLGTSILSFVTSNDAIYFYIFSLLVILDVFTKQLSLASQYVAKTRDIAITEVPFRAKFYGIYLAFNEGVIRSLVMRDKIASKLATYLLVIVGAILTDSLCFGVVNDGDFILYKLAVAYLAVTEFISILENLRDGGNSQAEKLLVIVKKKVEKAF